jgi:hypothetical protein
MAAIQESAMLRDDSGNGGYLAVLAHQGACEGKSGFFA